MHTAIESSAQTKAVKLEPLVYRVEEIAQLLAISPRDAPKVNIEERTIWDEKTMLAALQTIENPALHLAVHMSMILSLREGEILGLQPSDLDFDAADGRGTISVSKTMQRANKDALEKLDLNQVYHTFPDRREGSKSSLILKKPKTKKSTRIL